MTEPTPSHRPRVVIVQNSPDSGPGRLPVWLDDEGIDAELTPGEQLAERLDDLDGIAGLVLLGGGFMPDNFERAPFLRHERALVEAAIDDDLPLLGICLGSQLLAQVAGGEVTAESGETERGMCAVELLDTAHDDPLFAPLTDHAELRMIQNHKDSITALPPAAVHLATSPTCRIEAFRVGESAWGMQFHPEASPAKLATWSEASLAADGYDRDALVAAAEADAPTNTAQARTLIGAFADVVRSRGEQRAQRPVY